VEGLHISHDVLPFFSLSRNRGRSTADPLGEAQVFSQPSKLLPRFCPFFEIFTFLLRSGTPDEFLLFLILATFECISLWHDVAEVSVIPPFCCDLLECS